MKRRLICFGMLIVLFLSACTPSAAPLSADDVQETAAVDQDAVLQKTDTISAEIPCRYTDFHLVHTQLSAAVPPKLEGELWGALLPHYAPAMQLGANLLGARTSTPDTVIIIAPNHSGQGANLQICGASYIWESGSMPGNTALAEELAAALSLEPDDRAAQEDWSASLQIPYLASYFPDTEVVTILVSRGADAALLVKLGETLAALSAEQEIFLLGSVDFSHDQSPQDALRCDEETHRLISAGDPAALLPLGNAYLDSPETVAVLMAYAKCCGMELVLQDTYLETFLENGRQKAGSYAAYALIKADGDVPADGAGQAADDQSVPE